MPERSWDHAMWYANPTKAADLLGWRAQSSLAEGLFATRQWLEQNRALAVEGRANTVLEKVR